MNETSGSRTSTTLLGRLRHEPADQAAWKEFVERYSPKICGWCRHWRLQPADADDVTQNVLSRLATKMRTFVYDPSRSFRSWLKTLTRHALSDFLKDRTRQVAIAGQQTAALLQSAEARDDLLMRLNEEFDRELLEEAMARIQLRVTKNRWEAFRLTALEGQAGAEVAAKLGMKVATVFTVKSKVNKMLQEEILQLEVGRSG